ncbi:hypothetical protein TWF132_009787 [Orbilia oligospora]|nr:hypothetical protein TWF128_008710 [Orbilia oligospora]KAF3284504.1 hypothetical protein TWF132_009787 [Orbilia oligospora]
MLTSSEKPIKTTASKIEIHKPYSYLQQLLAGWNSYANELQANSSPALETTLAVRLAPWIARYRLNPPRVSRNSYLVTLLVIAIIFFQIQNAIGYVFKSNTLVEEALESTGHARLISGKGDGHRRLALLGDKVLGLVQIDQWYGTQQTRGIADALLKDNITNRRLQECADQSGITSEILVAPEQAYLHLQGGQIGRNLRNGIKIRKLLGNFGGTRRSLTPVNPWRIVRLKNPTSLEWTLRQVVRYMCNTNIANLGVMGVMELEISPRPARSLPCLCRVDMGIVTIQLSIGNDNTINNLSLEYSEFISLINYLYEKLTRTASARLFGRASGESEQENSRQKRAETGQDLCS